MTGLHHAMPALAQEGFQKQLGHALIIAGQYFQDGGRFLEQGQNNPHDKRLNFTPSATSAAHLKLDAQHIAVLD